MTSYEIFLLVRENLGIGVVVLIVVMSLMEFTKIKINPWSFIGNIFNRGLREKIDEQAKQISELTDKINNIEEKIGSVEEKITDVEKEITAGDAQDARYRILRFEDEIRHGVLHTKEHYDQIIDDINKYEEFSKNNKWFRNNQAHWAIATIRDKYAKHNLDNSFL